MDPPLLVLQAKLSQHAVLSQRAMSLVTRLNGGTVAAVRGDCCRALRVKEGNQNCQRQVFVTGLGDLAVLQRQPRLFRERTEPFPSSLMRRRTFH
jgi:hypothetical protein